MESEGAWRRLSFQGKALLSLQPFWEEPLPSDPVLLREMIQNRQAEANVFLIWDAITRLNEGRGEELGLVLPPGLRLKGFTVSYINNGPDEPSSVAVSLPLFEGELGESSLPAAILFRNWVSQVLNDPAADLLMGVRRVLANRSAGSSWKAEATSLDALMKGLLEPPAWTAWRGHVLNKTLESTAAATASRPRF